ncbi:Thioredoxin [Penicillium diatomitis]|uniref:Thioredoxin n=1 Tax=Penicillium diatomitis TaxID=2819901 RepID=A0A9W9XE82_9EURO|nr:Thioredoxin [Penicillium diatomitis]KAJ5489755.1 Thioredoxin [Penicillium diatomitis]
MAEEVQLGSIQERIAALKRSQAGGDAAVTQPSSFLQPSIERNNSSVHGCLSYNVKASAPQPASNPTPSPRPEVRPKKIPPPLPTRSRTDPPPSSRPARPDLPARPEAPGRVLPCALPEARPTLPPRPITDPPRKQSQGSVVSDSSSCRGGTGRPQEELKPLPRSESSSNSMVSGLSSKISALRGKVSKTSSSTSSSSSSAPQPPSTRPSAAERQSTEPNGEDEEYRPTLPARRLPPTSSTDNIEHARQAGFGGLNRSTGNPPTLVDRPSVNGGLNGGPPPVPHGSRPSVYSPPKPSPPVPSGTGTVTNIDNPRTFEELISSGSVLVDFYATYCGPCKQVAPKIRELADAYQNVRFLQVDIEVMKTLARQYEVRMMPTFILMQDGEEEKRILGTNVWEIEQWLKMTPGAPEAPTHGLVRNANR